MLVKRAFLLCVLVLAVSFNAGCGKENRAESTGGIIVTVRDGFTNEPIEGAKVTVPEAGITALTGPDGSTEEITLPVFLDTEYEKLLPSHAGRVSVLASAEGKTPYLLLYARVHEGKTRKINVLLFPDDGSMKVFTVCEAPDMEWCEKLAEKYLNE